MSDPIALQIAKKATVSTMFVLARSQLMLKKTAFLNSLCNLLRKLLLMIEGRFKQL